MEMGITTKMGFGLWLEFLDDGDDDDDDDDDAVFVAAAIAVAPVGVPR